ncbi:MAG: hypothetical protein D6775_15575 [Caldilineae bacterium]|nr:MAG: hypothetical protein D6775_15575 [Caldilineae bacterium]
MHALRRIWLRLRGHDCYSCEYSQTFRSSGDGQVSRLHTFCRHPRGPYRDRPIPAQAWCDHWQRARDGRKGRPEEFDQTGLTA